MKKHLNYFFGFFNCPITIFLLVVLGYGLWLEPSRGYVLFAAVVLGILYVVTTAVIEGFRGYRVLGWKRVVLRVWPVLFLAVLVTIYGIFFKLALSYIFLLPKGVDPVRDGSVRFVGLSIIAGLILMVIDLVCFSWKRLGRIHEKEWRRILKKEGKSPEYIDLDVREKWLLGLLDK